MKTGKKDKPKPLVEKVAEAKPVDDAVGKITEKAPVVTETAPPPPPKVEEKPVEKKPDPPKVVEKPKEEPKQEPKPVEKKPDPPKVDPIAEAHQEGREEAAAEAGARPPSRRSRRSRRRSAPSISRRSRRCSTSATRRGRRPTGDTLNSNAALGLAKGTAADNSATWGSMFQAQVERCWKKPYGGIEAAEVRGRVRISPEARRHARRRCRLPDGTPATPLPARLSARARCARSSSASRTSLPAAFFDEWKIFRRRVRPSQRVDALAHCGDCKLENRQMSR